MAQSEAPHHPHRVRRAMNQAVAIIREGEHRRSSRARHDPSQLDFLRRFVDFAHASPVAGEYIDDGISGTVPLASRPEGQRLLIDAEARSLRCRPGLPAGPARALLRALLEAHERA
jgi:hypothetical protein